LEIYRELALKYPESYNSDVAMTLYNLGFLYSDLQSYDKSKEAYIEALEIYQGLAKRYPEIYGSNIIYSTVLTISLSVRCPTH